MVIDSNSIDEIVLKCWNAVRSKIESGHELSSEKTLCFLFAIELLHEVGHELCIDFENKCFDELNGESKYLDLLFYTDPEFKIAIEFKLPKKTKKGGSNITQVRRAVYRDLARLNYLKNSGLKPKACFFLMAANEGSYFNKGNLKKFKHFITAQNYAVTKDNDLTVDNISMEGMSFKFIWDGLQKNTKKYSCIKKYAWLKPIKV
ncbi:hypothetical protein LZ24_02533 [Desulfobotulus alkaliphilus]|uniref:Uncharacterized protein n=1 Tax=Desulfobotulus alkaliphilus TaxID=622671 RepID=A0A562RJL8_9BACT|nr:hypothetical protein [Desulfobotulus alkaliphilus]TWI68560.1 hypothetical protein LZ24_02533 [Desulfobotulus alkaliphilus]